MMRTAILLLVVLACGTSLRAQTTSSWEKISSLPPVITIKKLELSATGELFALTDDDALFSLPSGHTHWERFPLPTFSSALLNAQTLHYNKETNTLFVGTSLAGLSFTTDRGETWEQIPFSTNDVSGIHEGIGNIASEGSTIVVTGDASFANGGEQRYFYSTNNGTSWSEARTGPGIANDIAIGDGFWLAATTLGLQYTTDNGITWTQLSLPIEHILSIEKGAENTYYAIGINGKNNYTVFRSTNLQSWTAVLTIAGQTIHSCTYAPQLGGLLLGTSEGCFLYSFTANNLQQLFSGSAVADAEELLADNTVALCSPQFIGVQIGEAPNYHWQTNGDGLVSTRTYTTLAGYTSHNTTLYTSGGLNSLVGIMPHLDSTQWHSSLPTDATFADNNPLLTFLLASPTGTLYCGGIRNLYASADNGEHWRSIASPSAIPLAAGQAQHYFTLFTEGRNGSLFATQNNDNMRLYRSENAGATWEAILDADRVLATTGVFPIKIQDVTSDHAGTIYVMALSMSLKTVILTSSDGGTTWLHTTPSNISEFTITNFAADRNNKLYVYGTRDIAEFGELLTPVALGWNGNNTDIKSISPPLFDTHNTMFVNVTGTEFCQECGVYTYRDSQWINHYSPRIFSAAQGREIAVPTSGLVLVHDSIPIVRTAHDALVAPNESMGYYKLTIAWTTDVQEQTAPDGELHIYPNPSSLGRFTITSSNDDIATILVSDIRGAIVASETNTLLDLHTFPNGVYNARISMKKSKKIHVVSLIKR